MTRASLRLPRADGFVAGPTSSMVRYRPKQVEAATSKHHAGWHSVDLPASLHQKH